MKKTQLYTLEVCVKGKPVTVYEHQEHCSSSPIDYWVEGRKGSAYTLRLRNYSSRRAKFVVSVDGLSINNGKPAGLDSPGYIVEANGTLDVPGWLVDASEAAQFVFGSRSSSYAASKGEAQNTGVIGLMVFEEKYTTYRTPVVIDDYDRYRKWNQAPSYPPVIPYPYPYPQVIYGDNTCTTLAGSAQCINNVSLSTASASKSTTRSMAAVEDIAPSLGTDFGSAVDFKTSKVNFESKSRKPDYTYILYYDNADGLNKKGIVLDWQHVDVKRPNAFPADPDYCEKPVGWS